MPLGCGTSHVNPANLKSGFFFSMPFMRFTSLPTTSSMTACCWKSRVSERVFGGTNHEDAMLCGNSLSWYITT